MKNEEPFRLEEGLRRLARDTRPEKPLPSAEQLWWRAEVIRRLVARDEAARQAEKPLLWCQAAALVLILSGLLALLLSAAEEPRFLALFLAAGLTPLTALLAFFLLRRET